MAFRSFQQAEGESDIRWMDKHFLWWLLSQPELHSWLLIKFFVTFHLFEEKIRRIWSDSAVCLSLIPLLPYVFLLSQNSVNWFSSNSEEIHIHDFKECICYSSQYEDSLGKVERPSFKTYFSQDTQNNTSKVLFLTQYWAGQLAAAYTVKKC